MAVRALTLLLAAAGLLTAPTMALVNRDHSTQAAQRKAPLIAVAVPCVIVVLLVLILSLKGSRVGGVSAIEIASVALGGGAVIAVGLRRLFTPPTTRPRRSADAKTAAGFVLSTIVMTGGWAWIRILMD